MVETGQEADSQPQQMAEQLPEAAAAGAADAQQAADSQRVAEQPELPEAGAADEEQQAAGDGAELEAHRHAAGAAGTSSSCRTRRWISPRRTWWTRSCSRTSPWSQRRTRSQSRTRSREPQRAPPPQHHHHSGHHHEVRVLHLRVDARV